MSKQKTILTAIILFLAFSVGTVFVKSNLFSGPDNSFRDMPSQEQLKILREIGEKDGPVSVLSFLKKIYPDEPADEHELAHVIGEAAFLEMGYSGFGVCDSFMRFACYHGVILEAIKQKGYSQEVLRDLGSGCLNLDRNRTTITACIHGIGHGFMVVNSYDLLPSYKDCDKIFDDPLERFFCYDGVSMENVVRRQEQADAKNLLESKNPYFPCSIVPEQYQPACVREHVHYARRVFYGQDTLKTQNYCLYFKSEPSRKECFGGLGNAINQDFFDDPEKVIAECRKVTTEYQENCFGVAATQYSYGRQFEKAVMICNALDQEPQRVRCAGAVESAKASLN